MNLKNKMRIMSERQQEIAEQLSAVEQKFGALTPQNIVDYSRPADSPLHEYFEWDDAAAAEKYRLQQARLLIHKVYVVAEDEKEPQAKVRYYHSVETSGDDESPNQQYMSVVRIMSDDALRVQMLNNAKRDMATFASKYRHLNELADLIGEMEQLLEHVA